MKKFALALHGGAGTILREELTPQLEMEYTAALSAALDCGIAVLSKNGTAIDAVLATVNSLEDCPLFNAGKGAVFNNKGKHEMDASLMCGKTLKAGAVAGITGIKNPINLAKAVMDKTEHVLLIAEGAHEFARLQHFEFLPEEYFDVAHRYQQWLKIKDEETFQLDHSSERKMGTVGAVAYDMEGNIAAATSTGGMTNKKYGRVGDTAIIGAGTYANNETCAISCTGHGELFMRVVVAHEISALMEHKGLTLEEACHIVVKDKLVKINGEGGLVAIDKSGNFCLPFNSAGMYRAAIDTAGNKIVAIF